MRLLLLPVLIVCFVGALALGWREPIVGSQSCTYQTAYGFHLSVPGDARFGCPAVVQVASAKR